MERANIYNRLATCVGDALVSKSYYSKDDESDTNKRYRFDAHKNSFLLNPKQLPDSTPLNEIDHEHYQGNDQ